MSARKMFTVFTGLLNDNDDNRLIKMYHPFMTYLQSNEVHVHTTDLMFNQKSYRSSSQDTQAHSYMYTLTCLLLVQTPHLYFCSKNSDEGDNYFMKRLPEEMYFLGEEMDNG